MILNTYKTIIMSIILIVNTLSYGQCLKTPEYQRKKPPSDVNKVMEKILHFAKQENFNIEIYGTNKGSAFIDVAYSKGVPVDIICINFIRYNKICELNEFTNAEISALFYWIIGHEFNHINKKHDYIEQSFLTKRLYQEVQSDSWGGMLLAAKTDVGIDFFNNLKFIFNEENKKNIILTHPEVKYRILAAKGGWLEEKIKSNNADTILSNNKQFIKYRIGENNYKIIEEGKNNRFGLHIYPNKDVYYGYYNEKGQRHGDGVFEAHEGENDAKYIYMGEWSKGNKEGLGIQFEEDNSYYKVLFDKNDKNGQGVLIVPEEYTYKGAFKNNKKHGQGRLESDDGEVIYSGNWVKGKKDGFGIEVNKEKKTLKEGIWKEGKYLGKTYNYIE